MRWLLLLLMSIALLAGCGGGGSSTPKTALKYSVYWDERGRTVNAPSSALSGILSVSGPGGSTLAFTFNRPDDPAAVLQTLTTSTTIAPGDVTFLIRFMSQKDGAGDEVARAAGAARIASDGSGMGTVTTVQNIARVAVVAGQSINEGETRRLEASAFDAQGRVVAVTAASIIWSVVEHGDRIRFVDNVAEGRARGTAKVAATVDRIASPPAEIFVSFTARVIEIMPAGGGDGITFVNALTPDGKVAVGTTRSRESIEPFRWTEAGGTVGLGTPAGFTGASAFAVNDDGSVIVGTATDDAGGSAAWKWTAAGGLQILQMPAGSVGASARGISGDGTIIVGYAQNDEGEYGAIRWAGGQAPEVIFDGQAFAITRDGTQIVGFGPEIDRTVALKWTGAGYFTSFYTTDPNVYLSTARAVSNDGSVVGGSLVLDGEDIPGYWSPTTSVVQINGGVSTSVYSVSADGKLMGGGAPSGGIAFYWTATAGLQNLGLFLDRLGLLDEFGDLGPGTINGISADKSRFAITGYPSGGGVAEPRGFIVELPDFMDR